MEETRPTACCVCAEMACCVCAETAAVESDRTLRAHSANIVVESSIFGRIRLKRKQMTDFSNSYSKHFCAVDKVGRLRAKQL